MRDLADPVELYVFREAVREFWATRERQAAAQRRRGEVDRGLRAAVTGGQQMNGFLDKIVELVVKTGVPSDCIYT